jgi:hypothetical protein
MSIELLYLCIARLLNSGTVKRGDVREWHVESILPQNIFYGVPGLHFLLSGRSFLFVSR